MKAFDLSLSQVITSVFNNGMFEVKDNAKNMEKKVDAKVSHRVLLYSANLDGYFVADEFLPV